MFLTQKKNRVEIRFVSLVLTTVRYHGLCTAVPRRIQAQEAMEKMARGFALTAQACRRTRSLFSSATSARSIPANYDIVVVGLVLSYILYVTHFHVGIFVITSPLGSGLFLSVEWE